VICGRGVATHLGDSKDPNPTSSRSNNAANDAIIKPSSQDPESEEKDVKVATQAELDEELRMKLEGISGEGGNAGVEYEGGKAVGLKRGVRDNMFRVI